VVDRLARRLMRAIEPELRVHLGEALHDRGLIGELYLRVRDLLAARGQGCLGPGEDRDLAEEVAWILYLVVSTHAPAGERGPALLVALQDSLLTALAGAREGASDAPPRGRSDHSRR